MSALLGISQAAVTPAATERLEDALAELVKYGDPSIRLMSRGWYCGIEMHHSALGASFDVRSEYDHKTPMDAARQCIERVHQAVNSMTGGRK